MKGLHIHADIVPRVYRVRVERGGELLGEGTHQACPADIEVAVERVRQAFDGDVDVTYWEA